MRNPKKNNERADSFKSINFQSHSSVERAGLIGCVKMREITADDKASMRGSNLQQAIQKDKSRGLVPFFVSFRTSHSKG